MLPTTLTDTTRALWLPATGFDDALKTIRATTFAFDHGSQRNKVCVTLYAPVFIEQP